MFFVQLLDLSFAAFLQEFGYDEFKITGRQDGARRMLILTVTSSRTEPQQLQPSGSTEAQQLQQQGTPFEQSQRPPATVQRGSDSPQQQLQHLASTDPSPALHLAVAAEQYTYTDLQFRDKFLADQVFMYLLSQYKDKLKRRLLQLMETRGVQGIDLGEAGNPQAKSLLMSPELCVYRNQVSCCLLNFGLQLSCGGLLQVGDICRPAGTL